MTHGHKAHNSEEQRYPPKDTSLIQQITHTLLNEMKFALHALLHEIRHTCHMITHIADIIILKWQVLLTSVQVCWYSLQSIAGKGPWERLDIRTDLLGDFGWQVDSVYTVYSMATNGGYSSESEDDLELPRPAKITKLFGITTSVILCSIR